MQSTATSRHPKYRTKLCRNFVSGDCPFGQKCSFLHPTLSIDSTSLASNLLNWNALLFPQLLAFSNQQEILRKILRRSPPRSQAPQLVDEDPSPTASLLLFKSDFTSSEQMSQSKRSNRRKKYPCRHFVRTGGWCPAAGQCRFQHDVAALPSGLRRAELGSPFAPDEHKEGARTISGGVLMGVQSPSPLISKQVHSEPSQYIEPELMQSYQPMPWADYSWPTYRPCYAVVPIPATPPSAAPQSVYPQPQPQAQSVPQIETQTSLPLGSFEVNGTTYFPTSRPSVSAPPPMPYSIPGHPVPYNAPMVPVYPYYSAAPSTQPAGYYDAAKPTANGGPQNSATFNPSTSDKMVPDELPVIPRLEDYQMSPIRHGALSLPSSDVSLAANCDLGSMNIAGTGGTPTVIQEEFPYRPPREQQVGHARRISVNIKKHGRVNSS